MLDIQNLTLSKQSQTLCQDLSFQISTGQILNIMGASGSGKSTVLNWLIGALAHDFQVTGKAFLNGKRIDHLPTQQRQVGILFQDDLLFPHWNIEQNLAFALPSHIQGTQRTTVIQDALEQAELLGFEKRDPATLSGGQRARISLLRTLLAQPKALLLDEPFSKLDTHLRQQFRRFVFAQITQYQIPTILVTHDQQDIVPNSSTLTLGEVHCV